MRRFAILAMLCVIGIARAQPVLSVSLSSDRPQPGEDFIATVVVFDGAGDMAVGLDLPAGVEGPQVVTVHANPVGLAVVRLHVRADTTPGARTLRFRAGGRMVERQIYVGTFAWPAPVKPHSLWFPLIRR